MWSETSMVVADHRPGWCERVLARVVALVGEHLADRWLQFDLAAVGCGQRVGGRVESNGPTAPGDDGVGRVKRRVGKPSLRLGVAVTVTMVLGWSVMLGTVPLAVDAALINAVAPWLEIGDQAVVDGRPGLLVPG